MALLGSIVNGSITELLAFSNVMDMVSNMTTLILMFGMIIFGIILIIKAKEQQ